MSNLHDKSARGAAGMAALNAGDPATARRHFQAIIDAGGADETVWLAFALAASALKDADAANDALDRVLASQPSNLRAIVMKGDLLWDQKDHRGASTFYSRALSLVEGQADLPAAAAAELARIRTRQDEYRTALDTHLRTYVRTHAPGAASGRFDQSLNLLSGTAQRYIQEPRAYYFPELPCVQFYDSAEFDWARVIEAQMEEIVAEFEAFMQAPSDFSPYIHAIGNKPVNPDHPLLDNMDWSALFLERNGVIDPDTAARFPKTVALLNAAPLERVPGRGPSTLISRLAPDTRIAPHTGFLNTRLTCHVPLRVHEGCGLRVGNETRLWEPGKLLIFNDAINHEAWNNAAEDRYVLIFQVWRPELTGREREQVSALLQGIDAYQGSQQP